MNRYTNRKIARAERAFRRASAALRRAYARPYSPRFAGLANASARAWAHLQRVRAAAGLNTLPFTDGLQPPVYRKIDA